MGQQRGRGCGSANAATEALPTVAAVGRRISSRGQWRSTQSVVTGVGIPASGMMKGGGRNCGSGTTGGRRRGLHYWCVGGWCFSCGRLASDD